MSKPIESLSLLGQHIRSYRKANRYSLQQLGDKVGIAKAQLWAIETRPSGNPRLTTLVGIAEATETSLARVALLAAMSLPHSD